MSQAVLILAHKDFDQVYNLTQKLGTSFNVYIHFDKKMKLSDNQKEKLSESKNVTFISKYEVKWGSYSIVKATLLLLRMALDDSDNEYVHLISGQDWPTKSSNDIYDYYVDQQDAFLNYYPASEVKKTGEPLIWWMKYYFNYDAINRRSNFGKIYHRLLLLCQTIFRVDKLKKLGLKEDQIYSGQQWFDLPRDIVEYVLDEYDHNKTWERLFKNSFCSDEFWLPTILMSSKYKHRLNKAIHRYLVLEYRNGSRPAILDETDLEKIVSGDYFWARKIAPGISDKLIRQLENFNES